MKRVAHTSMFDSGFVSFKLHYSDTTDLAIGDVVRSEVISVGGHSWRVNCYPREYFEADNGEYITLFLKLTGKSKVEVKAIFEAFLMIRTVIRLRPMHKDACRFTQLGVAQLR